MMRKRISLIVLAVSALLFIGVILFAGSGPVKEPSVAGAFYPAEKETLSEMVRSFLSRTDAVRDGDLIALIAPHAGYQYSGAVAAAAYNQIKGREIDTIVLIGPSHYAALKGASVYTNGKMRTPLGDIPIDTPLARSLLDKKADIVFSPEAFDREHSLEVQFPFLQTVLKKVRIVPILIGAPTRESFQKLVSDLTVALRKNKKMIVIASTDLSHYHDYATAVTMDRKAIDSVSRMSPEDLERDLSAGAVEMCGGYPVLLTMAIARNLGATQGVLFSYANSGDMTDDRSRVVGYAAMGLYRSPLSTGQRAELLELAKKTVVEYVKKGKTAEYRPRDERLSVNGAAFVTLNRNGQLRGCIGNIQPMMPLYQAVAANAVSAATRDPRFRPVTREELDEIEIEVTVLSSLEPIEDITGINIGKHGLYLVKGLNAGLLLPQVAQEYNWDVKTFLEQVSNKAGLPADAWKSSQVFRFTADVIK